MLMQCHATPLQIERRERRSGAGVLGQVSDLGTAGGWGRRIGSKVLTADQGTPCMEIVPELIKISRAGAANVYREEDVE